MENLHRLRTLHVLNTTYCINLQNIQWKLLLITLKNHLKQDFLNYVYQSTLYIFDIICITLVNTFFSFIIYQVTNITSCIQIINNNIQILIWKSNYYMLNTLYTQFREICIQNVFFFFLTKFATGDLINTSVLKHQWISTKQNKNFIRD